MVTRAPDEAWQAAMRQLERRVAGGPFTWRAGGLALVEERLERAMQGPHAADHVGGLLRLASALRRRLASPAAADALIGVLRAVPGARALARRHFGSGRREAAQRRFREATGGDAAMRAPTLTTPGPKSTGTPLRQLIDPFEQDRRRARTKR